MIDQIKNKNLNAGLTSSKKAVDSSAQVKSKVQKVDNPSNTKIDAYDGKVSQFITKEKIKSMSKEPPIDKNATTRIKEAIRSGNYPIDLSKITDALFDAYKEMK